MRFSARTWALLSVLLFIAAAFFWLKGNEHEARKRLAPPTVVSTNAPTGSIDLLSTRASGVQLATLNANTASATNLHPITADAIRNGEVDSEEIRKRYPHRLRNTQKPLRELVRDDNAVLLANALIDTTGEAPQIPEHLRADADPGSYIVQWHRPADARFRARLAEAGARIISYVPNNAYYVKVDKSGADALAATPGVQSVLPYQPYYKFDPVLLGLAVKKEPLPEGAMLRLTFLPDSSDIAQQVNALGADVVAHEPSPFGPQLIVSATRDALVPLAKLSSVQSIERTAARRPASDLSRVILGVATNGTADNYLGLDGSGVLVNINDTGIQPNHPTLVDTTILLPAPPLNQLITANNDPDGHGTFVASLIGGNGAQTPPTSVTNTVITTNGTQKVTNVVVTPILPGSSTNTNLRGMAPNVDLLALPLDPTGTASDVWEPLVDTWLIETAAQTNYVTLARTNTLISNNSWTYDDLFVYDTSAARFDQAVRDSLPAMPHHQPLLFVFAAGNKGFGADDGLGGNFDSIESPGTAKNVITVGALETPRFITNAVYTNYTYFYTTNTDGTVTTHTNAESIYPFADVTDSDDEVAEFSSRGNVGIGLEGDTGRFKPDVVAPGTMLIAARSAGWNFNEFDTNDTNFGTMYVNLHTNLQPYRFGSGSTYAAANVSGVLALIQEYFQGHAPSSLRKSLSPALMKALLINGARTLSRNYDIATKSPANYQGWGLPSLPHSLPSYHTNDHASITERKQRLRYVEQSAADSLATGQSRTWMVTLNSNAVSFPLRATLVWTDPPGNPSVAVKLVNNLDLVITNLDTGLVYHGNNIPFGGSSTEPRDPYFDDPIVTDVLNNVEQVTIPDPSLLGQRFSVTVRAQRVNVNAVPDYFAVTGNQNDVVQDFALVISSDFGSDPSLNDPDPTNPNGYLPNLDVFDEFTRVAELATEAPVPPTTITNGLPLLDQRVGANPSLLGTNGVAAQWNFYVFTNITLTNDLVTAIAGSNVAFVTFNPPNLSRPRAIEADIDLYVSKDPKLLNLNQNAIAGAFKSVDRGGTESVVFTNAAIGDIYYIAVKSEDQQAAEFSLIGVSSDRPFEEERNGRIYLRGVPFEAAILDGNPKRPTAGIMLAIGLSSRRIAHAQVTTSVNHENYSDLVGVLSKSRTRVVLNNHSGDALPGTNTFTYEDNPMFAIPNVTRPSDGPGSLNELVGYKIVGPWFLEMIDNAPGHTGRVQQLEIVIDPLRETLDIGSTITGSVEPGQMAFYGLDTPPNVTNLNFLFTVDGPLEFYWREGLLPTTNSFDFRTNINPPGATFDLAVSPGRSYFIGLRNPGAGVVNFTLTVTGDFADTNYNRFYAERVFGSVRDVVTTNSVIDVGDDKLVSDVFVGVQMRHPRTADLALTLITPQGSRILLAENRGGSNTAGFGSSTVVTNGGVVSNQLNYVVFTDRTNLVQIPVKFANPGTSNALGGVGFNSGFEGSTAGNYLSGTVLVDGWLVTPGGQVSIIEGPGFGYNSETAASLGTAGLSLQVPVSAGRPITVRFAARRAPVMDFFSTGVSDTTGPWPSGFTDLHYHLATSPLTSGPAPAHILFADEEPFTPPASWTLNGGLASIPGSFSQWISPYARVPNTNYTGEFIYRTYVNLYETNPASFFRQFRWAADDVGAAVRINGTQYNFGSGTPSDFWNSPVHNLPALAPGLNIIDFVANDTIDAEGLRVDVVPVPPNQRLQKNPTATMNLVVGGVPRTITVTNRWVEQVFTFASASTNETIVFQSNTGEVWIDEVSVESSGGVFIQPEEPFELIEGERAMGEWRLEVRDTRTGAILPTSEVLNWSLELNFADTFNPALAMQPGDTLGPITLGHEEVLWVVLDPCQGATFARLVMTGSNNFDRLVLFADLNGFPTGNPETDEFIPIFNNENPGQPNGRATFDISTLLPAPARLTGKPIFIGIINAFLGETNTFDLEFVSDGSCSTTGTPPVLDENNPRTGTLGPNVGTGSNTNSNDGVFQFTVPTNAIGATVTVISDGDVTVLGQQDTIPTTSTFAYRVDAVAGAGTETLVINTNSTPALVPGGTYFIRVANDTAQTVNFTINVAFDYGIQSEIRVQISRNNVGGFRLDYFTTVPGVTYVIEATSDLASGNWVQIGTKQAVGPIDFFDVPTAVFFEYRFFRIRRP